jgi:hypothetical protein
MNQFEQTVEFVFYNSVWQFNHNQSFIEPIYFSGTNATANAAASRTNLGVHRHQRRRSRRLGWGRRIRLVSILFKPTTSPFRTAGHFLLKTLDQ